MRFVFIDRVVELTRLERIAAIRQLTASEAIFEQHFPGNPMLPASLLIEACAQAATILLEASSEYRRKAYVGFVREAKFRRAVRPGHEMLVGMDVIQGGEDGALLRGTVSQCGHKCATVEVGMVTAPMTDFFAPHQLPYYLDLHRRMLDGAEFVGFDRHPLGRTSDAAS